jgi:oligopeptide/dipeptide ABC transporter ATP-binding protein
VPAEFLLTVRGLVKQYPVHGSDKVVHACDGIDLDLRRGQTVGIIGESGSGKTTLGRCLLRLVEPTAGSVVLDGVDLTRLDPASLRRARRKMHIVFQEPALSMNPQLTVGYQIAEPLRIHTQMNRAQRKARVVELLEMVKLPANFAGATPAGLSGGELQRCSIARALAADPDLVVLDEPASALPPATAQDVIALLKRLQAELGLAYIFISHDLSLVRSLCDTVVVMYLGQTVESGPRSEIFERPRHPYTRALLAAALRPDPEHVRNSERLDGEIPSPIDLPRGCYLASRCHYVRERCRSESQVLRAVGGGHMSRCWRMADGDVTQAEIDSVVTGTKARDAPVQLPQFSR